MTPFSFPTCFIIIITSSFIVHSIFWFCFCSAVGFMFLGMWFYMIVFIRIYIIIYNGIILGFYFVSSLSLLLRLSSIISFCYYYRYYYRYYCYYYYCYYFDIILIIINIYIMMISNYTRKYMFKWFIFFTHTHVHYIFTIYLLT